MSKSECEHKFVHLETKKWREDRHFGLPSWYKVNRFFCEKCLHEKETRKSDSSWDPPEWY